MTTFPPGRDWDILIIGGGITGAGILLEAARRGLKALLVEQRDFAWGTSSRSSKLVHGGLRYLTEGGLRLARDAVREREALLRAAPGLVEPQGFAIAALAGHPVSPSDGKGDGEFARPAYMTMLRMVDLLTGRREHRWDRADRPGASRMAALGGASESGGGTGAGARIPGGIRYTDAKTDDARLVLRVLDEARQHGATALNYVTVQALVRDGGKVHGAMLRDERSGAEHAVRARVVVNATGAWSDLLDRDGPARTARLRPLRGTHLVLPGRRLALTQALSMLHPLDGRPVFVFPWEGVILVGTTDVDHDEALAREGRITRAEFDYLMVALQAQFPQQGLLESDVVATFASVRPVAEGGAAPSSERREHLLWSEPGMISVAGGKLTTFRSIALDVLRHLAPQLPGWQLRSDRAPVFARVAVPARHDLPAGVLRRLAGRHGAHVKPLLKAAQAGELDVIPGTLTLWAELRWAARAEQVHRLDDLLLRRTRLGLQLAGGGVAVLPRIRAICQPELGWSDEHWEREVATYLKAWRPQYGVPAASQGAQVRH